ncbi:MAG: hydantoinase B/oxoprolinase family protein [Planctomycetota bacterium]
MASALDLEVFEALFAAVAEEMGICLMQAAFSPNIKERRDFSCAVFDAAGAMVAHAAHIPVHLGSTPLSVEFARKLRPMGPGDMVILNDLFHGGTHLPDITLVAPVHVRGKPSFFVANRAHHADVGGIKPGSMALAREIYQEGLRLPPVRLVRGGRVAEDVLDIVLTNVRTPEERRADLQAQIAANLRGAARLAELAARYGVARLQRAARDLCDWGERLVRAMLGTIRKGTFRFRDRLDDDGAGGGPVSLAVAITIEKERARVDFTGSAAQVPGPMNANLAITRSAVFYAFRCLLEQAAPSNAGIFRPIAIVAEEGSVVNARAPAAVAAGNVETSQRIVDVLFGALAKACPERVPAASQGTMNTLPLGGVDQLGRPYTYSETLGGGAGASATHDGASGLQVHMTNTLNTPIEALEAAYPLRVNRLHLRRGSGGAGARRGGDGIVREIVVLTRAEVALLGERRTQPPPGLQGGRPGACGRDVMIRAGRVRRIPGKYEATLEPGDAVRIASPGGGGHGRQKRRER